LANSSGNPQSDEDRRLVAWLVYNQAILASFRSDHGKALAGFYRTAQLLEPLIFNGFPTYDDCLLIFKTSDQTVSFFMQQNDYQRAADCANNLAVIANRLS
jgi:hypothetical protein